MTPGQITTIRKRLGLTQAELADLLGISRSAVIAAERKPLQRGAIPAALTLLDHFGDSAVAVLRCGS